MYLRNRHRIVALAPDLETTLLEGDEENADEEVGKKQRNPLNAVLHTGQTKLPIRSKQCSTRNESKVNHQMGNDRNDRIPRGQDKEEVGHGRDRGPRLQTTVSSQRLRFEEKEEDQQAPLCVNANEQLLISPIPLCCNATSCDCSISRSKEGRATAATSVGAFASSQSFPLLSPGQCLRDHQLAARLQRDEEDALQRQRQRENTWFERLIAEEGKCEVCFKQPGIEHVLTLAGCEHHICKACLKAHVERSLERSSIAIRCPVGQRQRASLKKGIKGSPKTRYASSPAPRGGTNGQKEESKEDDEKSVEGGEEKSVEEEEEKSVEEEEEKNNEIEQTTASPCGTMIASEDIRHVLSQKQFGLFLEHALEGLLGEDGTGLFRCPNERCGLVVEKIQDRTMEERYASMALRQRERDAEGRVMTLDALRHRERFRLRCPCCEEAFCTNCSARPYHLGLSCEGYRLHTVNPRCRFCKEPLDNTTMDTVVVNAQRVRCNLKIPLSPLDDNDGDSDSDDDEQGSAAFSGGTKMAVLQEEDGRVKAVLEEKEGSDDVAYARANSSGKERYREKEPGGDAGESKRKEGVQTPGRRRSRADGARTPEDRALRVTTPRVRTPGRRTPRLRERGLAGDRVQVLSDPLAAPGDGQQLHVCRKGACRRKLPRCCLASLPCGHRCHGVRGERLLSASERCCLCLDPSCDEASSAGRRATQDDYCQICWVERLGSAPCSRLSCGHVFHYDCLLRRIGSHGDSAQGR